MYTELTRQLITKIYFYLGLGFVGSELIIFTKSTIYEHFYIICNSGLNEVIIEYYILLKKYIVEDLLIRF